MVHNKATKVKKAFNLAFLALCRAPGNIWLLPLECAHNPPLVTLLKASITLISPGLLHCGTRVQFLFTLKTELCLNLRSRSIGNGTHVGRRSGYVRVFAPLFPPISWPISPPPPSWIYSECPCMWTNPWDRVYCVASLLMNASQYALWFVIRTGRSDTVAINIKIRWFKHTFILN